MALRIMAFSSIDWIVALWFSAENRARSHGLDSSSRWNAGACQNCRKARARRLLERLELRFLWEVQTPEVEVL